MDPKVVMGKNDRHGFALYRRRGISHFDCTSVVSDLSGGFFVGGKSRESFATSNVKTGASAALDAGDTNVDVESAADLVLRAPNFRTEFGYDRTFDEKVLSFAPTPFAGLLLESVNSGEVDEDAEAVRHKFSELQLVRPEIKHQKSTVPCRFEFMDHGARYYRLFFAEHEHQNFFGVDDQYGPMGVSLRREACSVGQPTSVGTVSTDRDHDATGLSFMYRVIVRTPELEVLRCCVLEDSIEVEGSRPKPGCMPAKDVLQFVCPTLPVGCLRLGQSGPKIVDRLIKMDEQNQNRTFKFGILFCRAGQSTEEEMYNNEVGSASFEKFLKGIGTIVELQGFEGYRAQLDNKHNGTGTHSVYTRFHGNEIMFHVSTMLPYSKEGRQQLQRKRHIGNDIITVVFQEDGSPPFTPATIRSHFQHVFIVVRELLSMDGNTSYMVAVTAAGNVPPFGPPLPVKPVFELDDDFREFLLTKLINAEGASHRSSKFLALTRRTRFECLSNLAADWSTTQTIDSPSGGVFYERFTSALNSKSTKSRKKANASRLERAGLATRALPGGVVWAVRVVNWGVSTVENTPCALCVAPTYVSLLSYGEVPTVRFCVQTKSIIGWSTASSTDTITLYYNQGEFVKFSVSRSPDSTEDVEEVVGRLSSVTSGCSTQEATLRRAAGDGHLGFTIHKHGVVGEVDPYGVAWKCGLRQGGRILEMNSAPLYGQTSQSVLSQIKQATTLSVIVVPPTSTGALRGLPVTGRWEQTDTFVPLTTIHTRPNAAAPTTPTSKEPRSPPTSGSKRFKNFDTSCLSMRKRRLDKQWGDVVTAPVRTTPTSPLSKASDLKGVVEKAKRALAASGLSAEAAAQTRDLGVNPLSHRMSLNPSLMSGSSTTSWDGGSRSSFRRPGMASPLLTSASLRAPRGSRLEQDGVANAGRKSGDLSSRLHLAESEVSRLQDELAKVSRENRLLINIVDQLRVTSDSDPMDESGC